jgi:hypothetical protein
MVKCQLPYGRVIPSVVCGSLIYNPRSGRNEEDSADRFSAFAVEMGMVRPIVTRMITHRGMCMAKDVFIKLYVNRCPFAHSFSHLDCCCAWQAEGLREAVVHYILATKQHQTEEGGEADLALFLDTDMSILGQPRQGA